MSCHLPRTEQLRIAVVVSKQGGRGQGRAYVELCRPPRAWPHEGGRRSIVDSRARDGADGRARGTPSITLAHDRCTLGLFCLADARDRRNRDSDRRACRQVEAQSEPFCGGSRRGHRRLATRGHSFGGCRGNGNARVLRKTSLTTSRYGSVEGVGDVRKEQNLPCYCCTIACRMSIRWSRYATRSDRPLR